MSHPQLVLQQAHNEAPPRPTAIDPSCLHELNIIIIVHTVTYNFLPHRRSFYHCQNCQALEIISIVSCSKISIVILTFIEPAPSFRWNAGVFVKLLAVRSALHPFLHSMEFTAVLTSQAHHGLHIANIIVEVY
jgi:hypothetical protein